MNNTYNNKTNIINIIIYVLIVFALSGLLLMLHSVFENAGDYALTFPQFAPTLALAILLAIRGRKGAAFDVKRSFKIDKSAWVYCLGSILIIFVVFLVFGFVISAPRKLHTRWETPSLAISIFCVIAGCIGEEIGWRGFLLPALNRNLSLIISSLIIGIVWGAWHFDFENGTIGYLFSILFMTSLSVIISWVQVKSNGSILPAILFHFVVNLCAHTILFAMSFSLYMILSVVLACFSLILFLADRRTFILKAAHAL